MRTETEILKNQILSLPPDERAVLAQEVWDSIEHFNNPELEKAWLDCTEPRWQDIEEGKTKTISVEEAFQAARKKLKHGS